MTDSDLNRGIGWSSEAIEISLRMLLIITFLMNMILSDSS